MAMASHGLHSGPTGFAVKCCAAVSNTPSHHHNMSDSLIPVWAGAAYVNPQE